MTGGKRLCLNMIVRNEMANLPRCLAALADHVACWVIGDTGSTDGTQDFIRAFFAERKLPGELHSFPFVDFEQARNKALDHAYASALPYDYLLFADADMELVVEDADFRTRLTAPGYRLLQRTDGSLSYWNTRLVRRDSGARYRGVTHEYVDIPGDTPELHGAWYKDHATGSNRVDKFERDIRLLTEALRQDPDNHRYWFYLAQSYRDAGRTQEAVDAYARRAGMGGWDEEAWYARLQQARCLRSLGDEGGFLREALRAFNQRPWRAEPLWDLARFYRDRGMNDAAVLFCEPGLAMRRPEQDVLFLEDWVYTHGLREEFSITAYYARDPARKARGHATCDWLALNREIPEGTRNLARSNLYYYAEPLSAAVPSFAATRVAFEPPTHYRLLNPSVARDGERIVMIQRTANYVLTEAGVYETFDGAPITTRNFLLQLNDALELERAAEIALPADLPPPAYNLVLGFEDSRLFAWRGALWCSSTVRQLNEGGWCEQVLARLDDDGAGACRLADWRVMRPPGQRRHEKNWMPQVAGDALRFIYLCDPTRIVDEQGRTVAETVPPFAAERFRGGSQAVAFAGGWLALIHEEETRSHDNKRSYQHRFVWFDRGNALRRVSRRFVFNGKGIEFAAGLAWHPDGKRLLISYGVADCEAWIATVDATDIEALLADEAAPPLDAAPPPADMDEPSADTPGSISERFLQLAPFLRAVDRPVERRALSRDFDAKLAPLLGGDALPQIHCFYEVMAEAAQHHGLVAAVASMRAMGHPVLVWSYTPERLAFLAPHGVEVRRADDVVPRALFDRVLERREVRYFSDLFRYAVLYEHGGLWMDSDVVLLRPFPFTGEHFLNLQWRGGHAGHFVCGNVMYARPFSPHMRNLYARAIECLAGGDYVFGEIGPKLLSDYVMSREGAALQQWLFSPVLFNPIDWTETEQLHRPLAELADYLNDDRVFGVHLWNARTNDRAQDDAASLLAALSAPQRGFPGFSDLADRFDTDRNRHSGNRHCYARVYQRLLAPLRLSARRLLEIGLRHGLDSVRLWQAYFPFCHVLGIGSADTAAGDDARFSFHACDQSSPADMQALASRIGAGALDVVVDDGSHASYDQQLAFRTLFPLLADGGWYFIEDLDWQPPGDAAGTAALTKLVFQQLQQHARIEAADPLGIGQLADTIGEILFFDSHYEIARATLLGGMVAIRKRGAPAMVH